MIPVKHRLPRVEIPLILRRGLTLKVPGLALKVGRLASPEQASQAAIVVSTKVDKRATARNLLKRRLRRILAPLLSRSKPGFGLVLTAYPELRQQKFAELKVNLENLIKKTSFYNH